MKEQRITLEMLQESANHIFENIAFNKHEKFKEVINVIITIDGYTCFDIITKKIKMVVGDSAFKNLIKENLIDIHSFEIQLNGTVVKGEDRENVLKYMM